MDERFRDVLGARDVHDALASDPLYRVSRGQLASPYLLGAAVALLIVLMIVFGPSSDSRFIYTDF